MNAAPDNNGDYFAQAASWADDRQAARSRSMKLAWSIAGIAVGVAALEALALALLSPLKRVETQTILVDRQTGYVTTVDPARPERISADSALTRSFLAQYVIARESFDIATLKQNYRRVTAWSSSNVSRQYKTAMQASNPASPLATMPRTSTINVRILSVSPLRDGQAMVRLETSRIDGASSANLVQNWVALIGYRYSPLPMTLEERLVNPLGFEATSYRRDAEAVPRVVTAVQANPNGVRPSSSTQVTAP